jgi:hypothetical protein
MTWAVQMSAPDRPIDLPKVPAAWFPTSLGVSVHVSGAEPSFANGRYATAPARA